MHYFVRGVFNNQELTETSVYEQKPTLRKRSLEAFRDKDLISRTPNLFPREVTCGLNKPTQTITLAGMMRNAEIHPPVSRVFILNCQNSAFKLTKINRYTSNGNNTSPKPNHNPKVFYDATVNIMSGPTWWVPMCTCWEIRVVADLVWDTEWRRCEADCGCAGLVISADIGWPHNALLRRH